MTVKPHFEVDRKGLAKLLERKGKSFALLELIQNSLDEDGDTITVSLTPIPGKPLARLVVEDNDEDGFTDLRHAFTLFAESEKKGSAEKRGRFNIGEKLVIAACTELTISTTTGTVHFTEAGRTVSRVRRPVGSRVEGTIRMTRAEYEDACAVVETILIPEGVSVTFNEKLLAPRRPLRTMRAKLPTEIADDEGYLRPTTRLTDVHVHALRDGETAHIYELGIPVVPIDLPWHVDVAQKVPLGLERDSVRPAYRRQLLHAVTESMHAELTTDQAASPWVDDALANSDLSAEAVESIITQRFGDKRVVYDPSDAEANKLAVSKGYTVIPGNAFNKQQWSNIRTSGAAKPAGQVTPSPKPWSDDPRAPQAQFIDKSDWTPAQRAMASFSQELAEHLMGRYVAVRIANTSNYFAACYGPGELTFNQKRLGKKWFEQGLTDSVFDLLIHEFGHEYAGDHLSSKYHEALTRLGAKMTRLALENPKFFRKHEKAFAKLAAPAAVGAP